MHSGSANVKLLGVRWISVHLPWRSRSDGFFPKHKIVLPLSSDCVVVQERTELFGGRE